MTCRVNYKAAGRRVKRKLWSVGHGAVVSLMVKRGEGGQIRLTGQGWEGMRSTQRDIWYAIFVECIMYAGLL